MRRGNCSRWNRGGRMVRSPSIDSLALGLPRNRGRNRRGAPIEASPNDDPRWDAPWRPRARAEQGQSLVELALVLPFLMLVVLGIVKFGLAYNNYLILTDAVRTGA